MEAKNLVLPIILYVLIISSMNKICGDCLAQVCSGAHWNGRDKEAKIIEGITLPKYP